MSGGFRRPHRSLRPSRHTQHRSGVSGDDEPHLSLCVDGAAASEKLSPFRAAKTRPLVPLLFEDYVHAVALRTARRRLTLLTYDRNLPPQVEYER
jgi:hypothetical protein